MNTPSKIMAARDAGIIISGAAKAMVNTITPSTKNPKNVVK